MTQHFPAIPKISTARSQSPFPASADDFESRLEREKLDAMKELAYGASHEINNPLANISARAQTLLRDEQQPDRRRALEAIRQQAMRAHEMISDLMLFARPPALDMQPVDLTELLSKIAAELAAECERRSVRLTLHLPDSPIKIVADAQQLTVAINALCTNALEAIGGDGTIEITLRENTLPKNAKTPTSVAIEVMDTGAGITDEVRRHLFDPFFFGSRSRPRFRLWALQMLAHHHRPRRHDYRQQRAKRGDGHLCRVASGPGGLNHALL